MAFSKDNWMQGLLADKDGRYWHIHPRETLEGKDVHAALAAQFGPGVYRAFNHGSRIVVIKNRTAPLT